MSAIIKGSMNAIAEAKGISLAESFLDVDAVIIVDTSGSMAATDSTGGRSRYDQACDELKALQESMPGKLAVISFSSDCEFSPAGIPRFLGEGTDMAAALRFAKVADVPEMQFILISDGEPQDPQETLRVASTYTNKVNTIYVGPEARPSGRKFLQKLANLTRGQSTTADRVKELGSNVRLLLSATA